MSCVFRWIKQLLEFVICSLALGRIFLNVSLLSKVVEGATSAPKCSPFVYLCSQFLM